MTVPTSNMPSFIERVIGELSVDKKKAAILGTLTLLAVVMGGHMLLKSAGPSDVGAAVDTTSPGSSATRSPAKGLTMVGPSAPGAEDRKLTDWRSTRSKDGTTLRDLFSTDLKPYVRIEPKPVKKEPTTKPKEAMIDMMEVARAIRAQAEGLSLQSTMVGSNSSAVINGRVLRVGDYIEGFQIIGIHPRTCDVKKKGIKVSLGMEK